MGVRLRIFIACLLLAALAGSHYGVYKWGYAQAGSDAQHECQQQSVKNLEAIITANNKLVAEANTASLAIGTAINEQSKANASTTNEIRKALAVTASDRAACVFVDSVMRVIYDAADAADRAATAGIVNGMPGGAEAGR